MFFFLVNGYTRLPVILGVYESNTSMCVCVCVSQISILLFCEFE